MSVRVVWMCDVMLCLHVCDAVSACDGMQSPCICDAVFLSDMLYVMVYLHVICDDISVCDVLYLLYPPPM